MRRLDRGSELGMRGEWHEQCGGSSRPDRMVNVTSSPMLSAHGLRSCQQRNGCSTRSFAAGPRRRQANRGSAACFHCAWHPRAASEREIDHPQSRSAKASIWRHLEPVQNRCRSAPQWRQVLQVHRHIRDALPRRRHSRCPASAIAGQALRASWRRLAASDQHGRGLPFCRSSPIDRMGRPIETPSGSTMTRMSTPVPSTRRHWVECDRRADLHIFVLMILSSDQSGGNSLLPALQANGDHPGVTVQDMRAPVRFDTGLLPTPCHGLHMRPVSCRRLSHVPTNSHGQ